MYYASFGMLALVVILIINYAALKNQKNARRPMVRSRYRRFLIVIMAYLITDALWGILYDLQYVALTYVDTVIYFLLMVASLLLWTRFVVSYLENKGVFEKLLLIAGYLLAVYSIVMLGINFYTPIAFGFDEQGQYFPGRARFILLIAQVGLFLATSAYTLIIAYRLSGLARSRYRAIGISGIVMMTFVVLQSVWPLLPLYGVGCLLATCVIHTFVYSDEMTEHTQEMDSAKQMAYFDALTGAHNKLAYQEKETEIDSELVSGSLKAFGVIVFDLNGLKRVNDTRGHEAGDEYIKQACHEISGKFTHSPLYRIGGDEFVVILEGRDYVDRNRLLLTFEEEIENNQEEGRVVVSSGMGVFKPYDDKCYNDVFVRADRKMYERKGYLKGLAKE
ncbi:MAG: diguanylate cyclase [Lachnospiraceae bacterium]|jgi:diguanylate cyclase (GGDEF)-like protein|nr:diguanylate cyclase [Lachnospiraceae bacterium]